MPRDEIGRLADRAAALALPVSARKITALENELLGRPEFAPWDAAALKPAFFDLARSLRPPGGFAPARFFLSETGPAVSSRARLLAAGALEMGAVSHAAIRKYISLRHERDKFKPGALLLMLASLTAYGIGSGLLSRAFGGRLLRRRGPALVRYTREMNRYCLRLGRIEASPEDGRAAMLRDTAREDSSSSCLLRLSGFLAGTMGGLGPAASGRLEKKALRLARAGSDGGPLPDAF